MMKRLIISMLMALVACAAWGDTVEWQPVVADVADSVNVRLDSVSMRLDSVAARLDSVKDKNHWKKSWCKSPCE